MGIVRKTKSIKLLLHEFKTQTTAISTIELIKRLNSKLNKTTIYRVLENLVDDGVLHSFMGNDGVKWYAMCRNCTKSTHFPASRHNKILIKTIRNSLFNISFPNSGLGNL